MAGTMSNRLAATGQPGGRARWLGAAVAAGLFALGAWVLAASWLGGPELLYNLARSDRAMLADHDRRMEDLREVALGRREAPRTAAENHVEAYELQRLVFHRAGEDPPRAEAALRLIVLRGERFSVARLQEEKVAQARERDRVIGLGLVGIGFALARWVVRQRRVAAGADIPPADETDTPHIVEAG